ncbi:hypothetical protein BHG05_05290 [Klebsiella pneumoniae]|nr:hypothetical protein BHG05_05290 [Klebsiella pneumoniae]
MPRRRPMLPNDMPCLAADRARRRAAGADRLQLLHYSLAGEASARQWLSAWCARRGWQLQVADAARCGTCWPGIREG